MSNKGKAYSALKYAMITVLLGSYLLQIILVLSNLYDVGDERFFCNELIRFQTQGLWNSFADGISHLFVICSSALSILIGSNLLAIRLLNIFLVPLALFIWFHIVRLVVTKPIVRDLAWLSFAYVLLITKTGAMFFHGLNDPLMVVLALGALLFLIKYIKNGKTTSMVMAAILSGMMLWVRLFSVLILGGILVWMVFHALLQKPRLRNFLHGGMFFLVIIIVALIVQIPSLSEHGKLSFERKSSPGQSWNDRNWVMGMMRLPIGSVFCYAQPGWEQVEEYIDKNGAQSIPKGLIGQVKRDPKFMLDNFASNVVVRFQYILIVSIGLLFLPLLDFLRNPEFWFSKKNCTILPFLMVFFSVGLGVSLIIISYVAHRWQFMAVSSSIVLASVQLERYGNTKILTIFKYSQLIFLLGGSLFFIISKVI